MTQILIIEDEAKITRLLEVEFNYAGYAIEVSETGKDSLEKALAGGWGMILLDVMLPRLSGCDLLRRLRQKDKFAPVIMLIARDKTPDIVSGLDEGADDYVTKPFEIEELLA